MSDIDLLFQPADLPLAAAALASLGYLGKHKAADEGPGITKHTSTYKRPAPAADTPNPYLSTSGDRHVDPHGSLEECWFSPLASRRASGRAMAHTVNGQPAQALSANDLYLHLAVHLIYHLLMGKPSLVQLVDLLVVSQRFWPRNWTGIGCCNRHDPRPRLFWPRPITWRRRFWPRRCRPTSKRVYWPVCPPSSPDHRQPRCGQRHATLATPTPDHHAPACGTRDERTPRHRPLGHIIGRPLGRLAQHAGGHTHGHGAPARQAPGPDSLTWRCLETTSILGDSLDGWLTLPVRCRGCDHDGIGMPKTARSLCVWTTTTAWRLACAAAYR